MFMFLSLMVIILKEGFPPIRVFSAFTWSCAGLRVPLCSHYVMTDQSLGFGMCGKNPNGTPLLYPFRGIEKNIKYWQMWKAWVKLLIWREVSFNQVQPKLTFFKGTLWLFQRHLMSVWLLGLQNSRVCWEDRPPPPSPFIISLLDMFIL